MSGFLAKDLVKVFQQSYKNSKDVDSTDYITLQSRMKMVTDRWRPSTKKLPNSAELMPRSFEHLMRQGYEF